MKPEIEWVNFTYLQDINEDGLLKDPTFTNNVYMDLDLLEKELYKKKGKKSKPKRIEDEYYLEEASDSEPLDTGRSYD